eukprot:Polyplicarium_translucidae@DN759_c0_g1_i1.p1
MYVSPRTCVCASFARDTSDIPSCEPTDTKMAFQPPASSTYMQGPTTTYQAGPPQVTVSPPQFGGNLTGSPQRIVQGQTTTTTYPAQQTTTTYTGQPQYTSSTATYQPQYGMGMTGMTQHTVMTMTYIPEGTVQVHTTQLKAGMYTPYDPDIIPTFEAPLTFNPLSNEMPSDQFAPMMMGARGGMSEQSSFKGKTVPAKMKAMGCC